MSRLLPGAHTEVLVIGGGIIGLAVAWRAAQRGVGNVIVVDPSPGGGAGRVAAGMLAPVTELQYGEEPLLRLGMASNERYAAFAAELTEASGGQDTGYRQCGTIAVAMDSDDREEMRELHAFHQRLGLDSTWLTGREARKLEPMLAPGVRGGLHVADDHQVDGRRMLKALELACERANVLLHRAEAVELLVSDGRAVGVRLNTLETVTADRIVLAAGPHSHRLPGLPEGVLPAIRPVKGQILRLHVPEAYRPFLSRNVRAVVRGQHLYLVPRENGELVIGATTEEQGYDTTVTAGGVYELLRDAHELVPGITELPLVETSAGLRPGSPDNAPVLGPTSLPGLVAATGHHRNGVLLTPVTADLVSEYLATGEVPELARPFTPTRFSSDHPTAKASS